MSKRNEKIKEETPLTPTSFVTVSNIRSHLLENRFFVLLLAITSLSLYLNSLNGQFVSDDIPGFRDYPLLRNFGESVKTFQIQKITQSAILHTFGLNPIPLHLVSVFLHASNTLLVFTLLSLLVSRNKAFAAALLFAIHPVNSEAVAWISGWNYLFNALFFLLEAIFYTLYIKDGRKDQRYILITCLIFLFTSLFLRIHWLIVNPLLLMVLDIFFLSKEPYLKSLKTSLKYIWPLIAISVIYVLSFRSDVQFRVESLSFPSGNIFDERSPYFIRFPYIIYSNAELLTVPVRLTLYHQGEEISNFRLITHFAAFFLVLLVFVYGIFKNRAIAGLIVFYLTSIGLSFSPWPISWVVAERYIYIGSIAYSIALYSGYKKLGSYVKIKDVATVLLVLTVILYSTKTFLRNIAWSTPKKLWLATERVSPNSHLVHNNLGDIYMTEGKIQKAIEEFELALKIKPIYPAAMHNLGNAYLYNNQTEKAEAMYKEALKHEPNVLYVSYFNLAVIEYTRGNFEKSREYTISTLRIAPNFVKAQELLKILNDKLKEK